MSIPSTSFSGSREMEASLTALGRVELLLDNGEADQTWEIGLGTWTLGSSPQCMIAITEEPSIEARHLDLIVGKRYTLLKAVHPIVIEGRKVREWLIDRITRVECGNRALLVYPVGKVAGDRPTVSVVAKEQLAEVASKLSATPIGKIPHSETPASRVPTPDQATSADFKKELDDLRAALDAMQARFDSLSNLELWEQRIHQLTSNSISLIEESLSERVREPLRNELVELLQEERPRLESHLQQRIDALESQVLKTSAQLDESLRNACQNIGEINQRFEQLASNHESSRGGSDRSRFDAPDTPQASDFSDPDEYYAADRFGQARDRYESPLRNEEFSRERTRSLEEPIARGDTRDDRYERDEAREQDFAPNGVKQLDDGFRGDDSYDRMGSEDLYSPYSPSGGYDRDGVYEVAGEYADPPSVANDGSYESDEASDRDEDSEPFRGDDRSQSHEPDWGFERDETDERVSGHERDSFDKQDGNFQSHEDDGRHASGSDPSLEPDEEVMEFAVDDESISLRLSRMIGEPNIHRSPNSEPTKKVTNRPSEGMTEERDSEKESAPSANEGANESISSGNRFLTEMDHMQESENDPRKSGSRSEMKSSTGPDGPGESSHGAEGSNSNEGVADESIEAYMQRLLERVRGGPNSGASQAVHNEPSKNPSPAPKAGLRNSGATGNASTVPPRPSLRTSDPLRSVARPASEMHSDIQALRELANSNARRAINRSTIRRQSSRGMAKSVIVVVALISSIALFLIEVQNVKVKLGGIALSLIIAVVWGLDTYRDLYVGNPKAGSDEGLEEELDNEAEPPPPKAPAKKGKR